MVQAVHPRQGGDGTAQGSPPTGQGRGSTFVAIGFVYLQTDCTVSDDKEYIWATTLVIVDMGI